MSDWLRLLSFPIAVVLLLASVAGVMLAAPAASVSPVGVATGQSNNETGTGTGADSGAGALAAETIDSGGESVGTAVETTGSSFDRQFYRQASVLATGYNDDPADLGFGGGFITGNLVNLRVSDGSEETALSFRVTNDNQIEKLRAGERSDAKIQLLTDRETFETIATSDSPGAAFQRALKSGDIQIRGRGLFSSIVWTVLNGLNSLANLL